METFKVMLDPLLEYLILIHKSTHKMYKSLLWVKIVGKIKIRLILRVIIILFYAFWKYIDIINTYTV